MLPRLKDGDLVLIDTFDKVPSPKRVMAVYIKGRGSVFGTIHDVDGMALLTKSNPLFPPIRLDENAMIRGVVKKRLEEEFE